MVNYYAVVILVRQVLWVSPNPQKGTKIQPKVFLTEVSGNPLGSWTSAPSVHGCARRDACFFFQDFDRPDRSFGPGYPRE